MIIDKIQNIGRYAGLIKDAGKIAEYFTKNTLDSIAGATDKLTIAGTGYSFGPYNIGSGPSNEKRWEIHRDHCDVHIVLQGREYIEWLPVEFLKQSTEYNADLDVELFADTAIGTSLTLEPGYFCLCEPADAHKPSISGEGAGGIKTLIKVDARA